MAQNVQHVVKVKDAKGDEHEFTVTGNLTPEQAEAHVRATDKRFAKTEAEPAK